MVYWGVMTVAILLNTYTSKILPKLESFIFVSPHYRLLRYPNTISCCSWMPCPNVKFSH